MGKWCSSKFPVVQSGGVQNGLLILINETVFITFFGEILFDAQGYPRSPQQLDVGEDCVGIYNAEKIRVPKVTGAGTAFAVGNKIGYSGVYADPVQPWASGLYWIGICVQAADDDDEYVVIDFKGDKATLLE
jgi:hypothetical protein